ncbi:DUF1302 domain-containing protein [Colwellia sp. 4_MG-2023]|jgi:hypothetical protein|uniref:DUF1302 domain-containing protein n=1 Tax=unclassified Colwellia TaxID=196834 RepID=UPI001C08DFEC|nr:MULTISPECIES: DUF1302 domain-containing protein [unclassified Colwellia]MBU2923404.1 DUF1302 domain-containing protein [Colwellia sp. C2M11]MDO6508029.1 DUF1302 domain-containing protein [Colwellia sp. 5_MG-2023]MDO6556790.1 DUF1302 domain-containing protein [Colwellia sp. 4_MG-2023]MDO6653764.1 DUF1302 domain-containing protein [Colwellia sp. 3_MG-2023]MDO6666606.1 DUF1302 domain-containing protein [Colwellia sp. 2_MG-2023]
MKYNPRRFSKKPIAVGIAAALSMTLLGTSLNNAQAARWEFGDVEVNFDSTFSAGSSWRTENRNWNDNVAIANNPNNGLDFSQYNAVFNANPTKETIWQGQGGYSANGDNGNLNYDAGESFSQILKGTHELDIHYDGMGVFLRGMYYYDFAMMDSDRDWTNQISGQVNDPCNDSEAKEQVCADVRILDAYVYGNFDIADMPFSVRVGQQVISWGESTLIGHGISEINPVDISRLRAPGAELKEAFIPFGAVWGSLGITENFNIEAFYQYSWEKTILPPPGSYFSTNDFAGDGGDNNNVQLGFSGNPDIDVNTLMAGLNQLGDLLRAGSLDSTSAAQAYLAYPSKVTLRSPGETAEWRPENGGQYGLRFSWYLPELNETELSLYYVNYHSRRPLFSGQTADFGAASIGADLAQIATSQITTENLYDLSTFSQVKLAYPEDIKMYAMSFNTTLGNTAVAGEISYREDEPLQIDDVELLFAAMPQQLFNAGLRDDLNNISQLKDDTTGLPYASGVTANGFILADTVQAQMTITHLFGPMLGASQFVGLVEIGGINISDMPDEDVLRLNGPGTSRNGGVAAAPGLELGLQNGIETNPFPTAFAWGYKMVGKLDYANVFSGVNVSPRIVFSHDVKGITPDPLFLFIEDRKSVALGFTFDYQSTWKADINYNSFFDGVGTTNQMEDRDYISLSISYSI